MVPTVPYYLQVVSDALSTADVLRHCLCSLSPRNLLSKACAVVTSPNIVSKPRVSLSRLTFDGISRLNSVPNKMSQGHDVVSKGSFSIPLADTARTYARCHGRTQTGNIPLPRGRDTRHFGGWAVWENEWEKCICGSLWVKEVT